MTSKQLVTTEPQEADSSVAWWNLLHWPAGIWVLLIALGLMTIPFVIRAFMLAGIPEMPEPFDEVAYSKWDVPAADDAFTYYRKAAALHQQVTIKSINPETVDSREDYRLVLEKGWSKATDSMIEWLELHQEALKVWRCGTQKDGGLNLLPSKLAISADLDVMTTQRMFLSLAILEESRSIASGDLEEARQWARAAFRSGGHTSHRGCLIQGLTGLAIHEVALQGIAHWAEQPGVTSEQLQQALVDARSDDKHYEPLSNILKSEYLYMRTLLRSSDWNLLVAPLNGGPTAAVTAKVMKMLYWTIGEPEVCARIMRHILANQISEIDKPIVLRRKLLGAGASMLFDPNPSVSQQEGQLDPAGIDRVIKRSPLTRMVLPALAQVDTAFLRRQARQATLEALLAAQAYRRDHGEFPENLSQLVPQYLEAVPMDPCDPVGGPLHYRRDEPAKAILWSMGDDRADGGGVIDNTAGRVPDVGFELK